MTLIGKKALVTGGSRGIGRAIVERLAEEGAEVVFCYRRDEEAADELVSRINGNANVRAVRADLEESASLDALFEPFADGLDILVNNAAINPRAPITEITVAEFDRVMAVNARFPLLAMGRAASLMRDDGRIINVSTLNTALPVPGGALYAAGKPRSNSSPRSPRASSVPGASP